VGTGRNNLPVPSVDPDPQRPTGPTSPRQAERRFERHQVSLSYSREERYSYPFPPPDLLERYDSIIPNGAERIIQLVERQSAHRQDLESRVIGNDILLSRAGLISATVITLGALVVAGILAVNGGSFEGLAAAIGSIAILAGVFYYGTKSRRQEREHKTQVSSGSQPTEPKAIEAEGDKQ